MEDFIKQLPKIELHAHLNGSLSDKTLLKLVELKKKARPDFDKVIDLTAFRTLDECFTMFAIAHDLMDSVEAVELATECVICEFSEDNVVYLELRSTPRKTQDMTKLQYLQAIINTIRSCKQTYPDIIVKLIPSINISYGVQEATENFELFSNLRKLYPELILGIDLSGDPKKGKFIDYKPIFERARCEGFRFAFHCAEVRNDEEVRQMLQFMTSDDSRIGHGTFIDDSNEENWRMFREKRIPVEICLTSNVLCETVSSYSNHHITRLLKINHPFVICTDDYGVFKTSLTNELLISTQTFGMSKDDVVELTVNANRYSFTCDLERQLIADKIHRFENCSGSLSSSGRN